MNSANASTGTQSPAPIAPPPTLSDMLAKRAEIRNQIAYLQQAITEANIAQIRADAQAELLEHQAAYAAQLKAETEKAMPVDAPEPETKAAEVVQMSPIGDTAKPEVQKMEASTARVSRLAARRKKDAARSREKRAAARADASPKP